MFVRIFSISWRHLLRRCSKRILLARNEKITSGVCEKRELGTTCFAQGSSEFQHSKSGKFYQDAPSLKNQFLGDAFLRASLKRILPTEVGVKYVHKIKYG